MDFLLSEVSRNCVPLIYFDTLICPFPDLLPLPSHGGSVWALLVLHERNGFLQLMWYHGSNWVLHHCSPFSLWEGLWSHSVLPCGDGSSDVLWCPNLCICMYFSPVVCLNSPLGKLDFHFSPVCGFVPRSTLHFFPSTLASVIGQFCTSACSTAQPWSVCLLPDA